MNSTIESTENETVTATEAAAHHDAMWAIMNELHEPAVRTETKSDMVDAL